MTSLLRLLFVLFLGYSYNVNALKNSRVSKKEMSDYTVKLIVNSSMLIMTNNLTLMPKDPEYKALIEKSQNGTASTKDIEKANDKINRYMSETNGEKIDNLLRTYNRAIRTTDKLV